MNTNKKEAKYTLYLKDNYGLHLINTVTGEDELLENPDSHFQSAIEEADKYISNHYNWKPAYYRFWVDDDKNGIKYMTIDFGSHSEFIVFYRTEDVFEKPGYGFAAEKRRNK